MSTFNDLGRATADALRTTDRPWSFNRERAMARARVAVLRAIEPIFDRALAQAGDDASERIKRHSARMVRQMELEHAAGYRQGHQAALIEAATMLKRHGHRSAVTRLLALADAEVKTPARPRPVNPSPAGGPGPSAPDSGEVAPEPTETVNGAQRGVQGLYAHTAQEWADGGGRG